MQTIIVALAIEASDDYDAEVVADIAQDAINNTSRPLSVVNVSYLTTPDGRYLDAFGRLHGVTS